MTPAPVTRYLLLLVLSLSNTLLAYGQDGPIPAITISEIDAKTGDRLDLYSFLEKDLPHPPNNRCSNTWDVFYFRVNRRGQIDSLVHQGTLVASAREAVIRNIYATTGHWRVPKGLPLKKGYWFVYPYFDFAQEWWYEKSTCSEADKLLQKNLIELSDHFMRLATLSKGGRPFLLRPYRIGGGFDQQ